MTTEQFEHLVFRLSNTCFVRHWMNWKQREEPPYYMAFVLVDWQSQPLLPYAGDLERYGPHTTEPLGNHTVFIFERTQP
ncbi:hypothetical protein [Hymenobacter koreensis]|uniref:Uncharacterized protein n=1 Tax=Hymenobacter koreensis TaxID=1084523 RepID=A0ABP8JJA3_9BACT